MPKASAALLLYRIRDGAGVEVLLAHPGGPYWASRDEGAWSLPKGEYGSGEDPLAAALREFREETGSDAPAGPYLALGEIRQRGGKVVTAWAARGDLDPATSVSNTFEMEWPPRSGRIESFPEVDRAEWMPADRARQRLVRAQLELVDRLEEAVRAHPGVRPADGG